MKQAVTYPLLAHRNACHEARRPSNDRLSSPMYRAFHTGSHHACIGTLLALFAKHLSAVGQQVDVSIHESLSNTTEGQMT